MDISTFNVGPSVNNYALHNNLLSSVSTLRNVNQVPSVLTKEITPTVKSSNQSQVVVVGFLLLLICSVVI